MKKIEIGKKKIGNDETFIIVDVGSNHGGDLNQGKKLVDVAAEAGVDAVKFQSYDGDSLYTTKNSSHDLLEKYSIPKEWHFELDEYCKEKGVEFCSSVFDYERLEWLEEVGVPFHKIASGDITYLPFIEEIAKTGKPIILSTGTATLGEVEEAVNTILDAGNEQIVLLHCITRYPTEVEEANLAAMDTLEQAFNFQVGFSDHTESTVIPACAVSMGANVVEKHITLDENLDTPDHSFALKPDELKEMVNHIRTAEDIIGTGNKRPTEYEKERSRTTARRSIHTKEAIKEGETITENKVKIVRPAEGLPPKYLPKVLGKKASKDLEAEQTIDFDCLKW